MRTQVLKIESGANPPEVTVSALALMLLFTKANQDGEDELLVTFTAMASHFVDPVRFPLPQCLVEAGLDKPAEELTRFFEGDTLSENTRQSLELLASDGNLYQSDLSHFLRFVREELDQ